MTSDPQELAAAFIERTRVPPGVRDVFVEELTALLLSFGADCAARERAEKHELQRQLGKQKSRRMTEQEAHAALRQTAAAFVQKWHDGTVWGSDELRHFVRQFEQALRSL